MPQERQPSPRSESAIAVRSLGLRLPRAYRIAAHQHEWHQLVYAIEGVLTVSTPNGDWVVPPQRAVWIPARFQHSIRTAHLVRMRTLYLRPDLPQKLSVREPEVCCVVAVTALVRELVLEMIRLEMLMEDNPEHLRLVAVLMDQLEREREVPLEITFPRDPRARRVAEKARADLATVRTITELARGSGASARTIERIFRQETGLTFARWLQRLRTLHALELLAAGDSVTSVALAVGHDSTSAFIAMFKRQLGMTPGRYFAPMAKPDLATRARRASP